MPVTVRPAQASDAAALGRMGAELVRLHHRYDPRRFMMPEDDLESGYRWWLSKEMKRQNAVVLVAEQDGTVVGYVYATVEGKDWQLLLDGYGALHDVWVDASARGAGVGAQLLEELVRRLKALGAPRVVLMTAVQNEPAQRLFQRMGWRTTMLEMTRELE